MVVDSTTDPRTRTTSLRRRYLAYDLMVLNATVVANLPFLVSSALLERRADPRFLVWHVLPSHGGHRFVCSAIAL